MIQGVSISDMLNQSITVLTSPSVTTFEKFEKRGGMNEALTYVGLAAALVGLIGLVFGLAGGVGGAIGGLIIGFVGPVIGYLVFAFVLYYVGQQQGGTGTQNEVFYTTALYTAPLLAITGVVGRIPVLNCLLLPVTLALAVYQAYLGYLAARSSMNLEQGKAIISVVVAIVAQIVVGVIVGGILVAIFVGSAVVSGAVR